MQLRWGERLGETGFATLDPAAHAVIVAHRMMDYARHLWYVAYSYHDGRLTAVQEWPGPRPAALAYPDSPTFVLLAALTSVSLGLADETPRYFADPRLGELWQRQWSAALPRDAVWSIAGGYSVAEPFPGDAAVSPFAAWGMSGEEQTPVGLSGQVAFVRRDGRYLIQQIDLEPVTLQVATAGQAAALVQGQPEVREYLQSFPAGTHPADLPPAGFADGRWVVRIPAAGHPGRIWRTYAVDARTGAVSQVPE